MTEGKIQSTFHQMLTNYGGATLGFAICNESPRSKAYGAQLKRQGLTAGVPDYVVLWSDGMHARVAFIEFKTPKGVQSPKQKEFHRRCVDVRAPYQICRSPLEAWEFITAMGAPVTKIKDSLELSAVMGAK